ncbi:SPOR domain-containing protein [Riemerella columbina]|uniref:SPOR domain-containing protein n=1 Tax=Riemerella columbina TaxID=103810 RepID=UPI00266FA632|nr:SPOR domain-containing protein [Riemerella columbina]WKS95223.1 SPOR domain-containing protein [Riemerella columbina]
MKSLSVFIFSCLFSVVSVQKATAQLVVKKDTIKNTELTITTDQNVSQVLDNLENKCKKSSANNSSSNSYESRNPVTAPKVNTPNKALTNAEICRKNPRILGVKIQLAVVKSKAEADEVALYFRRKFPYIKVQQDASLRPNYKVLAGSYFTKEDASSDLRKIKAFFKNAIPVKYMIFCTDAL